MPEEIYLTVVHCRATRMCLHGVKRYCTRHGLDFKKIHAGTMPASEFDTGDAQAQKIIEYAKTHQENET